MQGLHQTSQKPNTAQKSSEITLDKNVNVVFHGILESFMKERKQRDTAVSHHVVNLLGTLVIPEHAATERVHRPE